LIDEPAITPSKVDYGEEGFDNSQQIEDQEDEDVIDIDNPEDLARRGLKRVQIEGDNDEYLLDGEGNLYNLQGEFVGTTDGADNSVVEEDDH
jgi:hypothetical protein